MGGDRGVGGWGVGMCGVTEFSSGYKVILPQKSFITKFPSLLIRFIMTTDGKYKTSSVNVRDVCF